MVLQYPYSLSLRYLLTMKSQQEDHKEHDRNIELLATYGIDRSHFFKIFRDKTIELEDLQESVLLSEDYLELKELSALEREMDKKNNAYTSLYLLTNFCILLIYFYLYISALSYTYEFLVVGDYSIPKGI